MRFVGPLANCTRLIDSRGIEIDMRVVAFDCRCVFHYINVDIRRMNSSFNKRIICGKRITKPDAKLITGRKMMGEIYFVRHGQASFGAANYDKLSDLGHQQAEWLGAYLADTIGGFDHVVSGDLLRHRQTLAGILKTLKHANYAEDPRLNEMSYFVMEQAYREQTGAKIPGNARDLERHFTNVMRAWETGEIEGCIESFTEFHDRILQVVGDVSAPGKKVLVVSSGGPVGVLLRHVLSLGLPAMTDIILGTHNASVTRFMVLEDGLRLMQFNGVAHLEQPDRQHALTFL
ncbi:MAG: broad specificity phosphatase PhoE [Paracoccaceae bacterium]|jgi:broad specificity phosphatase PhoE